MTSYLARRVTQAIAVLFIVTIIVFSSCISSPAARHAHFSESRPPPRRLGSST